MVRQRLGCLNERTVAGARCTVGVELNFVGPLSTNPFRKQQRDGTTEAVTADDDRMLSSVEHFQIALDKRPYRQKAAMEAPVRLAYPFVGHLARIQVTTGVGKHFLGAAHRN